MDECSTKKLSVEDAYKMLITSGCKVTLQEVESILNLMYKIAEIIVSDQLIN